jgi:hypothetical protein
VNPAVEVVAGAGGGTSTAENLLRAIPERTAPLDDLIAFLRARLDEDEQAAVAAAGQPAYFDWEVHEAGPRKQPEIRVTGKSNQVVGGVDDIAAEHIARHDPARVLREVEAKRRLIQWCEWIRGDFSGSDVWKDVLPLLALPYADHSDYRAEWRPED